MDSATTLSNAMLPETLLELVRLAAPKTYADVAVLTIVALTSAGDLLRGKLKLAGANAAFKQTRNIAQKMEESNKNLVVFWDSQSGTAEGFANRLARECHLRFGFETMATDLSDYDAETIKLIPKAKLAIFIVSTFGEGDPGDNTSAFWDWLQKMEKSLSSLRYMASGLGNSNYKYYNRVIDAVCQSLDRLGANRLMPIRKADDAEGATEEDFMAWKDELFAVFRQNLGIEEREVAYEPTLSAVEDTSLTSIDLFHGEPVDQRGNSKAAALGSLVKKVTIQNSRELFTTSSRNCIHMELDLTDQPESRYKTGDHLAVWPTNPDAEVETLLQGRGLSHKRDVPISITSLDSATKAKIPTPTTVEALFRYYLEICAPVSRDTILSLAQFAPSTSAKTFPSTLGKDKLAYAEFLSTHHLTIGRLLKLALASDSTTTWSSILLSFIIETIPATQPRYFSISSSSVINPRHPAITALASFASKTALANAPETFIHGLTSNYLLALSQAANGVQSNGPTYNLSGPNDVLASGTKLHAHIRRSKLKLPALASTPIVMVAAGTGLAPFRAFITERVRLSAMGKTVGQMILFFGCRNPAEDFIYREELEAAQEALGRG